MNDPPRSEQFKHLRDECLRPENRAIRKKCTQLIYKIALTPPDEPCLTLTTGDLHDLSVAAAIGIVAITVFGDDQIEYLKETN
jgi:hypothetical protein